MRAVIRIFASATVAVILIVGCQRAEDRYLKRQVTAEEIIGTWQMTPGTVKDLQDTGYKEPVDPTQHQIIFRPDGTCEFKTLPRVLTEDGRGAPRIEAECRWKLGNIGHQAVQIEVQTEPPQRPYYYFSEGSSGRSRVVAACR